MFALTSWNISQAAGGSEQPHEQAHQKRQNHQSWNSRGQQPRRHPDGDGEHQDAAERCLDLPAGCQRPSRCRRASATIASIVRLEVRRIRTMVRKASSS